MTPVRLRIVKAIIAATSLLLLASIGACGKDKGRPTCDKPKPYQAVVPGERVVIPDGLDPLDESKEMPIPKAETPPRPAGAGCIENAPSILRGGTVHE